MPKTERRLPQHGHVSPLRYPGGKSRLTNFVKLLFRKNDIVGGKYGEPYAGGASVAIGLLLGEYASVVHINDLDLSIHAFWGAVVNDTDALCRRISQRRVSVAEWRRQRAIQEDRENADPLDLAFSTFFLNRTNRSGVICSGGIIGGYDQESEWGIDARYNKPDLIQRIERIAAYRDRITVSRHDARTFLERLQRDLPVASLTYLDPPYYIKGQRRLYANYYRPKDHAAIAEQLRDYNKPWIVSYDNTPEIRHLYRRFRQTVYGLRYSAADRYQGSEVMMFGPGVDRPRVEDPVRVSNKAVAGAA